MNLFGYVFVAICCMHDLTWSEDCSAVVNDELWSAQWYLKKSLDKYDMNVLPAWRHCINGTGIHVGVVDLGVADHSDLNIDRSLGFGKKENETIPSSSHGTRIAGIIAAKKNKNFTIGIAFGAVIVDVKIGSTASFATYNATSLYHKMNIIDVYSCSWSNFLTGLRIFPLDTEEEAAFKHGTKLGRNGKGSVYVFSTGNFGNKQHILSDSCAYDGLVSNPYVIAVAGIQHDLSKVPNGEACANIMVAAFTAKPGEEKHKLVTLDVGNKTTDRFGDNSAAVPMVSGAIALALSANMKLTYRDVMHLLINTSRNNFPEFRDSKIGFFTNAAHFTVSSLFGFGLLDIGTFVNRSTSWKNVPEKRECNVIYRGCKQLNCSYEVLIKNCDVTYTEHVEVKLHVADMNARKIKWDLISPQNTKSTIIPGRRYDFQTELNITVCTVQMWGENAIGVWKLKPTPLNDHLGNGILNMFQLKVHGFKCVDGYNCQDKVKDPIIVTDTTLSPTEPKSKTNTVDLDDSCDDCGKNEDNHVLVIAISLSTAVLCIVVVFFTTRLYIIKRKHGTQVQMQ